jgi:hypothetical protein
VCIVDIIHVRLLDPPPLPAPYVWRVTISDETSEAQRLVYSPCAVAFKTNGVWRVKFGTELHRRYMSSTVLRQ